MTMHHPPCIPFGGFNVHSLLGDESWTVVQAARARQEVGDLLSDRSMWYKGLCKAGADEQERSHPCRSEMGSTLCL